jgi:membrane protease YdiL (CAAX protease family)
VAPQPQLQDLARQGTALPGFWLLVVAIVIGAPLAEELVFRGYLLGTLLRVLPHWPAQLVTAAVFGYVHGPAYALPIGVLGLLFGWLRTRHGALWPSMLAHAVHNGLTVTVTLLWPGHLEWLYPR